MFLISSGPDFLSGHISQALSPGTVAGITITRVLGASLTRVDPTLWSVLCHISSTLSMFKV